MSEGQPVGSRSLIVVAYAVLVFCGVFYALVIYPYQLDDLVKGALIGWGTQAIYAVFADQVANRTAKQAAAASASGAAQALATPSPSPAPPAKEPEG